MLFALLPSPWASAAQREDLEPSQGFFTWTDLPDPYHAKLREALVGEHAYRKCQMVVIPSFHREWAVYMVRDEGVPARLFFKSLKRHLWVEMMDVISDHGRKKSCSIGPEAQQAALAQVKIDLDRHTASMDNRTADVLEDVWWHMLGRVRHPARPTIGLDGTSYLVAHWRTGAGFRSGETWSPEDGSRTKALVSLAEHMAAFTRSPSAEQEAALRSEASALLARLPAPAP